jgi:hypothetical protein
MAYDIKFDPWIESHVMNEIDLARMPKHSPDPVARAGREIATSQTIGVPMLLSGTGHGTVRVLFLYASDVNNSSTLVSNIISSMNDSFFDDGMDPDLHVTLANTRQLSSDLDGLCKEEIRDLMEDGATPFSNIGSWQSTDYADIVVTIATTDLSVNNCSETDDGGRVGGIASDLLNEDLPYVVVMDTYAIGDYSAAHEIGHIFGGGHQDWSVATMQYYWPSTEPYARGYIASSDDWQTIMGGYDSNCGFSTSLPNTDCVRIPYWSDPDETYSGESRGVAYNSDTQTPVSADMSLALETQMPVVADFESYPYSAPATPANFRVISNNCYGSNDVKWNSSTNAENYQLLRSYSIAFTNPEVIYFGSDRSVTVNVQQYQTQYLKVRACNGSGCGNYSVQRAAVWVPNCL